MGLPVANGAGTVARGRRWLDQLIADPTANTESIAGREGCSVRKVNMTISLAFLAPDLVKAAIDGRLRTEWEWPASATCQLNGLVSARCLGWRRSKKRCQDFSSSLVTATAPFAARRTF